MLLRVFCAAGIAACLLAAAESLRLAVADRAASSNDVKGFRRAVALVPENARYRYRLAVEAGGNGVAELDAALRLNPRYSAAWIERGLRSEFAGNYPEAERNFMAAARVDRGFLPRWTLANYYFRRDNAQNFWFWAKQAAWISYGDLRPLFRLCWSASGDGAAILERAIPHRHDVLRQYLAYLFAENRPGAAEEVARKLLERPEKEDVEPLLSACDAFLLRAPDTALAIWNTLGARSLIPYAPLDPAAGRSLTNGDLARVPAFRGFDWRGSELPGVSVSLAAPPGLAVALSGRQPEQCDIFHQFVPVVARRAYRLSWQQAVRGLPSLAGLGWRVSSPDGSTVWAEAALKAGNGQEMRFQAPGGARLARVTFFYRRALGTVRIEGGITIRDIRLELQGATR